LLLAEQLMDQQAKTMFATDKNIASSAT
jgi:hypothetical protein